MVNPIIDWEDSEVWEYIREEKIKYCPLYDEGYTRLGCIGCPMGRYGSRVRDFARYPKYKEAYMRAIERMLKRREEKGLSNLRDAEGYFHWWIEDPNIEGQMSIDFDEEERIDD
jgi:phosphoadenosine phosphosulfate reductase